MSASDQLSLVRQVISDLTLILEQETISYSSFFNAQVMDDKISEDNGMIYDLSSLKTSSEEWTVDVGSKTFRLAVCKTLNPSSTQYLCPNTNSTVCSIDNEVPYSNRIWPWITEFGPLPWQAKQTTSALCQLQPAT